MDGTEPPDATRRRLLAGAGAGIGGLLGGGPALDAATDGDALVSFLDDRLPALLDRYGVPGVSIALVEDGEVTWTGAYGEADREDDRRATPDTLFRAASISKSITAWAVATLVEEGAVELDDPVERHVTRWELPESGFDSEAVTVRRLLSHTSGLQMEVPDDDERYAPGEDLPAPEAVLAGEWRGSSARFERPPGSAFGYSNAGFVLLELLVEEVTGRDYEAYVRSAVLEPLGMDDATFTWDEEVAAAIATGYLLDGDRGPVFVDPVKAPGGLYATAEDLARFVAASVSGPEGEPPGRDVIEPESVAALHTPVVETTGLFGLVSDAYGLGHFVETLPDGQRAVWHGGQHTGWLSHYHAVPGTGDGIVVLANSERAQRLLGQVVGAWADRRGLSSVAMSRTYERAATAVEVTSVVVGLAAAGLVWRLARGVGAGDREFAPLARRSVGRRVALAAAGVLGGALWWGVGRDVLTALLPVLSGRAGVALSALAALAVLTALFPASGSDDETRTR